MDLHTSASSTQAINIVILAFSYQSRGLISNKNKQVMTYVLSVCLC